jgi:hypothetical protein
MCEHDYINRNGFEVCKKCGECNDRTIDYSQDNDVSRWVFERYSTIQKTPKFLSEQKYTITVNRLMRFYNHPRNTVSPIKHAILNLIKNEFDFVPVLPKPNIKKRSSSMKLLCEIYSQLLPFKNCDNYYEITKFLIIDEHEYRRKLRIVKMNFTQQLKEERKGVLIG